MCVREVPKVRGSFVQGGEAVIAWLVSQCHVGMSYLNVLRYVISRMKKGKEAWTALPRNERKRIMRRVFEVHKENRELYRDVMMGKLS
jgi:acyl-CoA reductase-like NAD-dependent aldehyde dehydrogenase